MTKAAPTVINRSPDQFEHAGKPRGYSYQTGRVHSSWSDMEDYVARRNEARGSDARLLREDDPRKLRGVRYSRCCDEVQRKGAPCRRCGEPVGWR